MDNNNDYPYNRTGTRNIWTASGIMKLLEMSLLFTSLMIHRYGDHGRYVFFGTTAQRLSAGDDGMDVENLGNGTLVTYAILAPALLLSYIFDGRDTILEMFLEPFWSFLAMCCFLGLGICTLKTWIPAKKDDDFRGTEDYETSYSAGIALGALSIILFLLYTIDFWIATRRRKFIKNNQRTQQQY